MIPESDKLFKEVKSNIKELLRAEIPDLGDMVEKADRLLHTLSNAINWTQAMNPPIDGISLGDHLCTREIFYTHHGLYVGNRKVIHYARGILHEIDLEVFLGDREWTIVESPLTYEIDESIDRAKTRLGETSYNLIFNNCEHFVRWCRSGGVSSDTI